jgi:hypothetical protein
MWLDSEKTLHWWWWVPIPSHWVPHNIRLVVLFCFVFCGTRAWTQGLHLEPLHQPVFMIFFFFWDWISQTICPVWLWIMILLISASWDLPPRITGMSHQHLVRLFLIGLVKWVVTGSLTERHTLPLVICKSSIAWHFFLMGTGLKQVSCYILDLKCLF